MATADTHRGNDKTFAASQTTDESDTTYWATDDGVTSGNLEIDLGQAQRIEYVVLKEHIPLGQRVSSFSVDAWINDDWQPVVEGTTIGYQRILRIDPVQTRKIKVTIREARACPTLSTVAVY